MDERNRGWTTWRRVWLVVGIASACLGFLVWHPATVVGSALVGATVGSIIVLLQRTDPRLMRHPGMVRDSRPVGERSVGHRQIPGPRSVALAAVGGALSAVTLGVLGTVSIGLLFGVAAMAALSTPPSRAFWRAQLGRSARPAAPGGETTAGQPLPGTLDQLRSQSVSTLSDAELCIAWRRSFGTLLDAQSPEEKEAVVSLRQAYLDEMEARDAAAFGAWLESGARAAGGPERFWAPRTDGSQDPPYAA